MPSGWRLKGWKLPKSVPSVTYLATAPWLKQALNKADQGELWAFHETASKLAGCGAWRRNIRCIREVDDERRWKLLDGHVFFEADLRNPKLYPASEDPGKVSQKAEQVLTKLKALRSSAGLGPPSPFYALLLMDGDSLGKQLSDLSKQNTISQALKRFTQQVARLVDQHNGFLVYAGGDDVLALLPVPYALSCASALRQAYREAFESASIRGTISAAIEYTHYHLPFTKILADAHELLDDVAKDGCGRDAVAVRVWKPGGRHLEWALPWEIALDKNNKPEVQRLAEVLRSGEEQSQLAHGFFYRLRSLFELLPEQDTEADKDQTLDLVVAEYLHSGLHQEGPHKPTLAEAKDLLRPLLKQCRPVIRSFDESGNPRPVDERKRILQLKADGALLVKFLADGGESVL